LHEQIKKLPTCCLLIDIVDFVVQQQQYITGQYNDHPQRTGHGFDFFKMLQTTSLLATTLFTRLR
jgi:hypothetical protein